MGLRKIKKVERLGRGLKEVEREIRRVDQGRQNIERMFKENL